MREDGRGPQPLNPYLYRRLLARYGSVEVANEGETALRVHQVRSITNGKRKWEADSWGEYYKINCPYCRDQRHRLWVHYLFGTELVGVQGERKAALWLVHCFNENCLNTFQKQQEFEELVLGHLSTRDRRRLQINPRVSRRDRRIGPVELPGVTVPLTKLDDQHPALAYLAGRHFDPRELSDVYRVGFCVSGPPEMPIVHGRIIIPIYLNGQLMGWQARHIGETGNKRIPKYYGLPGMQKKQLLYNYDVAVQHNVMVVVEGVTDAWAVGPEAVALLGKTMSLRQKQLIHDWIRAAEDCVLAVMLDPETEADVRSEILPDFQKVLGRRLVHVPLVGKDPGDLARAVSWELIAARSAQQGVNLHDYRSLTAE